MRNCDPFLYFLFLFLVVSTRAQSSFYALLSLLCARSLLPPRVVFHPDSAIDIVVVTATTGEMAASTGPAQTGSAQTTNDDVDVSNKTKDLSTLTSISKRKDGGVNGRVTPYVFYCLLLLMLSNLILQVKRRKVCIWRERTLLPTFSFMSLER